MSAIQVNDVREFGRRSKLDFIVVIGFDAATKRLEAASWGLDVDDKQRAAALIPKIAAAIGSDPTSERAHEDFRFRTEAEWAKEKDQLLARITELESLLRGNQP